MWCGVRCVCSACRCPFSPSPPNLPLFFCCSPQHTTPVTEAYFVRHRSLRQVRRCALCYVPFWCVHVWLRSLSCALVVFRSSFFRCPPPSVAEQKRCVRECVKPLRWQVELKLKVLICRRAYRNHCESHFGGGKLYSTARWESET